MNLLTMEDLIECFETAKEVKATYMAIVVAMEGFPENEVIINKSDNFEGKLWYYQHTYDELLEHKNYSGIRIIDFAYADSFDVLEEKFKELI